MENFLFYFGRKKKNEVANYQWIFLLFVLYNFSILRMDNNDTLIRYASFGLQGEKNRQI